MSDPVRVLLDECIPVRLKRELPGFDVHAVREIGWASKSDGELQRAAEGEFAVFVTVDRNLVHQQNLSGLRLAIVVLLAHGNSLRHLLPLVPALVTTLRSVQPGQVVYLRSPPDERRR